MPTLPPSIKLNDDNRIPLIAYGSGTAWFEATGPNGISPQLVEATQTALRLGYNHLDAAKVYGNELSTGAAILASGIKRDQLFLTTKVLKDIKNIKQTLKSQLKDLKVDYVDLYLLHSPTFAEEESSEPDSPNLEQAWKLMEEIKSEGLTKSIGVSNYRIRDLEQTLKIATIKPAVNQIEFHPYVWIEAEPLIKYMKEEGIALAAYGPQAPIVKFKGGQIDLILKRMGEKKKLTEGQILLKWAKAHGAIVVTTSGKEDRMKLNLETISDSQKDLTLEEVNELNQVGNDNGVKRAFMKHMSE